MKKRTISSFDIPDSPKRIILKDVVYEYLKKDGKKTFMQLISELCIKSEGHLHTTLRNLMNEKKVKREICECCGATELYDTL